METPKKLNKLADEIVDVTNNLMKYNLDDMQENFWHSYISIQAEIRNLADEILLNNYGK